MVQFCSIISGHALELFMHPCLISAALPMGLDEGVNFGKHFFPELLLYILFLRAHDLVSLGGVLYFDFFDDR